MYIVQLLHYQLLQESLKLMNFVLRFNFFDCQLNKLQKQFSPTKNMISDPWLSPYVKCPYEASVYKTNFKFPRSFQYYSLYEFDVTFHIMLLQYFISSMVAFPTFAAELLTSKLISGLVWLLIHKCWPILALSWSFSQLVNGLKLFDFWSDAM